MDNNVTHVLRAKDEAGNEVKIIRRGWLTQSAPRGPGHRGIQLEARGLEYELPDGQPLVEDAGGRLRHEATGRVFSDLRA